MPEVCGDRELFSPSVGCADSLLGRGSKGHRQCWAKRGERELRGPEVGRKRQETAGSSRKQQAPPHVNVQRGLSVIFS